MPTITDHSSPQLSPSMGSPITSSLRKVVAGSPPYGGGGLGRHLAEMVEETRAQNRLVKYYSSSIPDGDPSGQVVQHPWKPWLFYTPLRYSPAWMNYLEGDLFDRQLAGQLIPAEEFEGLGGQSLHCFHRARQLGYHQLSMQAANSHVNNVHRKHHQAIEQYSGIESSWLNRTQSQKTLKEYAMADVIYVASEYTRQTFLAEGIPEHKLRRRVFQVHPRYVPAQHRSQDGKFRIVYVGSLTVMKGIPVLLEAFSRISNPQAELILVGGWATRGMKRYLKSWLDRDSRIRIAPGDPLPHLQQAQVCVHPSYEDGFSYAPMEALACGTPVIVTEDTGMKEYIREGENGYVIPSGDWQILLDRLQIYHQQFI